VSGRSQVAEAMRDRYDRLDRRGVDAAAEESHTFAP
jgi:hypothetical protein